MHDSLCLNDLSGLRLSLLSRETSRAELLRILKNPLWASGLWFSLRGEAEEARRSLLRAHAAYLRTGDRAAAADVAVHLLPVLAALDELEAAEAAAQEALPTGSPESSRAAYVTAWRGLIARRRGDVEAAERALRQAQDLYFSLGARRAVVVLSIHLGDLAVETDLPAARSRLERAVRLARLSGDPTLLAWATSSLAVVKKEGADALLSEAEKLARRAAPGLSSLIELRRGLIELRAARQAPVDPEAMVERVEAILEPLRRRRPTLAILETRMAHELLETELARFRTILSDGFRWDAGFTFVQVRSDVRIDLTRRTRLRAVLRTLIDERLARPGHGLSVHELFERSWPGDRSGPESAANRTYVSIARLRKLGLGGLIKTSSDGFLLDPNIPICEPVEAMVDRQAS